MVLDFQGVAVQYKKLLKLLRVKSFGAPSSNIRLLNQLGVASQYSVTDMSGLEAILLKGMPAILFVRTSELPYWRYPTDHALVVVGFDETSVFVNDPSFPDYPIAVSRGDFELAWLEKDYYYATISTRVS
jgi:uncharacterized protein YvpB